jgi:hypothetical protein
MPKFQVECKELAYVIRTYEIEAESADAAKAAIQAAQGGDDMIDEQIDDGYEFCSVLDAYPAE